MQARGCQIGNPHAAQVVWLDWKDKGVTVLSSLRHTSLWLIGIGLGLGLGLGLAGGSPTSVAWAQASKHQSEPKAEVLKLDELKKDLESRQESRVVGALEVVKRSPDQGKPLAPDIERLLATGTTLKISLNALRVLGALGQERSSKTIAPYVRHRAPSVRQTAATALLKTKGPDAVVALKAALRGSDRDVRDIAARGLGDLKDKAVLPDLFQALDQRVFAAAVSIGKLCDPANCKKFMGQLKKLQLEVITSATDEILFRPEAEIDEKTKLEIVEQIADLRTLPATEYLIDVYKRWPKEGSKSLKKAIGDAVEDNGGDLGDDE